MRKPETIEQLYLDFDSFFASVEQYADPRLRGRPVGVIPMQGARNTCIIAASKEAKAKGASSVMTVREAREAVPDMVLVDQKPDLYRRMHALMIAEIRAVLPIGAVKSIDELTCKLDARAIADPEGVSDAIKARIAAQTDGVVTCSIGMAPNRFLAKMACKLGKPDGLTIWRPEDLPGPLLKRPVDEAPGIGSSMRKRLLKAGVADMKALWALQPKQMRALWRNVAGERFWYALHGYAIHAEPAQRRMYGHGRVLPPSHRSWPSAYDCARLLTVKAARRMRRDGRTAGRMGLWLRHIEGGWSGELPLHSARTDRDCLKALDTLWAAAQRADPRARPMRAGMYLCDLDDPGVTQTDWLVEDNAEDRARRNTLQDAIDSINSRYAKSLVTQGVWTPPPGGYAGGKIAFTRIPYAEDFW